MRKQKGILIIEVLIGALILSILVTSVIYGLEQAFKLFRKANDITRATYLAEELLFDEITEPGKSEPEGVFQSPFEDYAWEIKRETDSDNPDFIKSTVIVKNRKNNQIYAWLSSLVEEKK